MRLNVDSQSNGLKITGVYNTETVFNFTILTTNIIRFSETEILYESGCLQISVDIYESIYANGVLSTPTELYDFIHSFVNPA